MIKAIKFKNGYGLTLRGFVHIPKKYGAAVIHLHGFPGDMFGTAKRMCRSLSKLGYLCMRFEFSGTNTSDGKFEDKLMSKEVKDIKYAIDFLTKNYKFKKLILIGHSTGAIDASLYAHKDKRINKLILMGAESDTKHSVRYDFTDEQVRDFWIKGHITYKSKKKWLNGKRLKKSFYDEFFTLDIPKAIKKYKQPLMIIHGEKDEAVPLKDGIEIFKAANRPKKLVIIKDADHRFKKIKHWKQLIYNINKFIKK